MKIHGLKDKWAELKQDLFHRGLEVAEFRLSIDRIAEGVWEELHESKERWTELKQENEQLKIVMLNLKQENAALNAAVANMQACLVSWGVPVAELVP